MKKSVGIVLFSAATILFVVSAKTGAQTVSPSYDLEITHLNSKGIYNGMETTDRSPRISGKSRFPNTKFTCVFNSEIQTFEFFSDSNGNWTCPEPADLSYGMHTFTISTTVDGKTYSSQLSFKVVKHLTESGSELIIGVIVAVLAATLGSSALVFLKKKERKAEKKEVEGKNNA